MLIVWAWALSLLLRVVKSDGNRLGSAKRGKTTSDPNPVSQFELELMVAFLPKETEPSGAISSGIEVLITLHGPSSEPIKE